MSDEPNLLGDHLRARRELVTPEQAGIPVPGVRRVAGLCREEVAMLAGISADYYLRLVHRLLCRAGAAEPHRDGV